MIFSRHGRDAGFYLLFPADGLPMPLSISGGEDSKRVEFG